MTPKERRCPDRTRTIYRKAARSHALPGDAKPNRRHTVDM